MTDYLEYTAATQEVFNQVMDWLEATSNRQPLSSGERIFYFHTSCEGAFASVHPETRGIELATEELERGLGVVDLRGNVERLLGYKGGENAR